MVHFLNADLLCLSIDQIVWRPLNKFPINNVHALNRFRNEKNLSFTKLQISFDAYHSRNASLSESLPDGGHGPKSLQPLGIR